MAARRKAALPDSPIRRLTSTRQRPFSMNSPIAEYIAALLHSETFGPQVAHHRVLPAATACLQPVKRPLSRAVQEILREKGIPGLYRHQAEAIDRIRAGQHVIAATPTASGKTLIYNLPVIEGFLANPDSRALYLFPLKALAQDQLAAFTRLTEHWPKDARPGAAVYDGDTSPHFRKKIRAHPPAALMTNPEMLHLALLPHHETWSAFFASLEYVVVDEAHAYRGILGSHMAQVFRRLRRVCAHYGAAPRFIFSSATIGNPGRLVADLTGLDAHVISENAAPCGARHIVFIEPLRSPAAAAIQLLRAALARGLRTIVYTQSRRMTELISLWAAEQSGAFKERISAYRAGFLPEERRDIEARMASGELLAVVSTSALELGIDIGGLDLCIMIGYPGTVMSFLQRGGRVGRACRDSAVAFIAGEDALDRHFIRDPQDFFNRGPEDALLNPWNPVLLERHLPCAAAELPLRMDEEWLLAPDAARAVRNLERTGALLRSADGAALFAARKNPQRDIDLRSAGAPFTIQTPKGEIIGVVDGFRACRETHPGAVYLHRGRTYVVQRLDIEHATAVVQAQSPNYYTRIRAHKTTEILETLDARLAGSSLFCLGRLRVTEQITGYEKRGTRDGRLHGVAPLDMPPLIFETVGLWFDIPDDIRRAAEQKYLHFMGAIHALEHAAIGVLPLLVMTDRNDLGGISTPMHPQTGAPAVFIYDGMPGGAGLSALAFARAPELLRHVRDAIAHCPCELGCPSCVHSPKCGSGNRPIDKAGALFLVEQLLQTGTRTMDNAQILATPRPDAGAQARHTLETAPHTPEQSMPAMPERGRIPRFSAGPDHASGGFDACGVCAPAEPEPETPVYAAAPCEHYVVFDVETQRSAQEVGGWHMARRMGVSAAVLYDSQTREYMSFTEDAVPEMIERMAAAPLVVGFNSKRFDYAVLSAYTRRNLLALPTLDILEEIRKRLSYRVSLDNLGKATLNAPKTADGLQALRWWKEGRIADIERYCREDVRITHELYLYGKKHGYLVFSNKAGQLARVPVSW